MNDNVFGASLEDDPAVEPSAPQDLQPQAPQPDPVPAPDDPAPDPAPAGEVADDDEAEFLAGEGEGGVRLGNKTYKDWQGADHVFRQFAGRTRAAEKRLKDAEERARKAEELLEKSLTRSAQEPTAARPEADPAPAPRRIADFLPSEDDIDSLIADKGPAGAIRAVLEKLTTEVMPGVVDERTADAQTFARRNKALDHATALFEQVSATGEFPELTPDDPASDSIVEIWTSQVLADPVLSQLAFTPQGVRIAVDRHRASAGTHNPQPSVQPAARLVAQVKQAATAQRGLADMGGRASGSRPAPGPTVTQGDLEEAARQAVASRRHEVFGFESE